MNPCFIYRLLTVYISAYLLINPVRSTDPNGNLKSSSDQSHPPDKGGGSPTSETKSSVTYIDLDLTKTESTNQYEYKKVGDVETYTAKEGYAIKSYSEGTDVKWESDGTKYYKEVKRTKQADGTYKYQAAKYNPTGQSQSKASTVQTQASTPKSEIKIITQVGDDTSKTKENDEGQYVFKQNNDLLEYKFKDGGKCVEVKYDKKEVWKYDESKANEHPESVLFNTNKNTVLVTFKSAISICNLEGDQWKTTFSGRPELFELDIKSKKDTDHWNYNKNDKVGTYTAKDGKFFNSVTQSSGGCCGSNCCTSNCCKSGCCGSSCCGNSAQDIWKSKDVSEYATKVIVKGIGSSTKLVAIFLLNGTAKGFHRDGSNKTWEEKTLVESKEKSSDSGIELDVTIKAAGKGFTGSRMIYRLTYTAETGYGFSKVKHGDKEIWSTTDKDKYAKKVVYDENKHNSDMPDLEIYLSDNDKIQYDKEGDKWTKRGDKKAATDQANKTSGGGTTPAATT